MVGCLDSLEGWRFCSFLIEETDTKVGTIAYRHYKYNFEKIPIPKIATKYQIPFEKLADEIAANLNRGISIIDSVGWYSKENKKILMVVVRKHETPQVFKLVKHHDPDAFISMASVMGVYGSGFEEIRA